MAILQPNPLMQFIAEVSQMLGNATGSIQIPTKYRQKVLAVKGLLQSDTSGMVNSVLDYAIDAANVQYSVESQDEKLSDFLTLWLANINASMRGRIPTGVNALAKEYLRERWKGSSFLLLRSFWEEKNKITVPTTLFFVDGEDIVEIDDEKSTSIDAKKYALRIDNKKENNKALPSGKDEKIFVQKPYDAWGSVGATPYLIARGVYKNLKFLDLLESKGEFIVSKALEYVALLKKGSEAMVLGNNPDFLYSREDLEAVKNDLDKHIKNRKYESGTPAYVTNFDTSLEHIIPEYEKALKENLYAPIERRIIAGLGLIEIVSGITMSRRESVLMPKPFFGEVSQGVSDYKTMLLDIIYTMKEQNQGNKLFDAVETVKIHTTAVKDSINERMISQIRTGYDRGLISKQSMIDTLGFIPEVEIRRRKEEDDTGLDDTMYPPVVNNVEKDPDAKSGAPKAEEDIKNDKKSVNADPLNKNRNETSKVEQASVELDVLIKKKKLEVLGKQSDLLSNINLDDGDADETAE